MKLVISLILLFITIERSQAALHPSVLKVEELEGKGIGQGVKVAVDDSASVRRLGFYFYGNLKPINEKGDVFLINDKQSIVGFNARPATQTQHIYLICEYSGMIETFSDIGVFLAKQLKTIHGDLDSCAFLLTSISGETATISYETHMRSGSFNVEVSVSKGALEIVDVSDIDK